MSIHPSLKSKKFAKTRNVRKKWERIKKLSRNAEWLSQHGTIYGLPKEKIKHIKLKIKDEKKQVEDGTLSVG